MARKHGRKRREREGIHRPLPGVVARRGVPGGFRGVGGGTFVRCRSDMPEDASVARCTSRTARRAASPTWVGGLSASIRDNARRRSCGSVAGGRGCVGGIYDEREAESPWAAGGAGCDREVREILSRAKRRSRSSSAIRVVCSAAFAKVCTRSIFARHELYEIGGMQEFTHRILQVLQATT